jgi:hypothetical protein
MMSIRKVEGDLSIQQLSNNCIKKVNDELAERIDEAVRTSFFDLPKELTVQICGFLQERDFGKLAQVNRHANANLKESEIQLAREYGYKGEDNLAKAKDYLKNLFQSIDTLVKDGVIPEAYVVRRGRGPFWHDVDSKATLRKIKHLKFKGADLKLKLNEALLHYSSLRDADAVACKALLQLGADIETREKSGYTPLALAALWGKKDVVEVLIQNGANVNSRDLSGDHPLLFAVGSPDIIRLLLDNGAVAVIDHGGYHKLPALHCAVSQGQIDTVKLLIEYGANIEIRTVDGHTVLELAEEYGHQEVVERLRAAISRLEYGINPKLI